MNDVFVTWDQFPNYGVRQYSRPHLNTMIAEGTFPPPVRLSANRIAWVRQELERWKATRPTADEPAPQLWLKHPPKEQSARRHKMTKPVGRPRGSKVVTDQDGKRRLVLPEELGADDAA